MKKIILVLLLLANSLFAVTISEIMNANPAYHRAFITQVDIRDAKETRKPVPIFYTKLNLVNYPYSGAGYPYTNIEYSGKITDWWYTQYYNKYELYKVGFDTYINPNNLSRTYLYVDLQGYSSNNVYVQRSNGTLVPYYSTLPNGFRVYLDTASSSITSYEVKTQIQTTDGSVDLYSNISISRNVK